MILSKLSDVFDLKHTIFFEGKLYEQMYPTGGRPHPDNPVKNKYRVVLAEDDYDYIQIPALVKRLDRAFKRSSK